MSTRITQSMMTRTLLSDLGSVTQKLSRTQQQLSSGKALTQPSDDPFAVAKALQLRADLDRNRQLQENVNEANSWQSAADSALSGVSDAIARARELVVQGASDTTGPQGRTDIAGEITQLIDSIKEAANTQYAGRFVFSGSATNTKPYQSGAVDTYAGNTEVVKREIGPGVQIDLNQPGMSVIGDAGSGLLATLRTIVTDLNAGNTAALGTTDLAALSSGEDVISNARAAVGSTENRLDTAQARLQQLEQAATAQLSDTEDTDMAQALVDYSTQQAVYQSALRSGAQMIQPSLMDFLNS